MRSVISIQSAHGCGPAMAEPGRQLNRKKLLSVRAAAIKRGLLTHEVDEGSPCRKCGDNCPGFSLHFWRKICKNCLCPREEHDVTEEMDNATSVGKLLFSPTADTAPNRKASDTIPPSKAWQQRPRSASAQDSPSLLKKMNNYVWVPKGCTVESAQAYFKALPANKTPVRGTPGERYRQKQLIRQLPAHDVDIFYCNDLTDEEKKQMEVFLRMRREKVLGKGEVKQKKEGDSSRGWACEECKVPIKVGSVGVFAERAGTDKCWHPACFTCQECKELLVDLIYFYNPKDNKLYCGRHHAEKVKPRCAACDELILCREYTRAEDQDWHINHFCCLRCDVGLGGKQYRPQDGQPFCLTCYEISFSTVCETCGNSITLDQPRLSHDNHFWHGTDDCFMCAMCGKSLVDQPFLPKHNKIFCSKEHAKQFKDKKK